MAAHNNVDDDDNDDDDNDDVDNDNDDNDDDDYSDAVFYCKYNITFTLHCITQFCINYITLNHLL